MSAIGPGDIAKCVRRPEEHPSAPWVFPPAVGSTWITRAVGPASDGSQALIALVGDGLPLTNGLTGKIPAWPLACFVKIDGPSLDEVEGDEDVTPATRERVPA